MLNTENQNVKWWLLEPGESDEENKQLLVKGYKL